VRTTQCTGKYSGDKCWYSRWRCRARPRRKGKKKERQRGWARTNHPWVLNECVYNLLSVGKRGQVCASTEREVARKKQKGKARNRLGNDERAEDSGHRESDRAAHHVVSRGRATGHRRREGGKKGERKEEQGAACE